MVDSIEPMKSIFKEYRENLKDDESFQFNFHVKNEPDAMEALNPKKKNNKKKKKKKKISETTKVQESLINDFHQIVNDDLDAYEQNDKRSVQNTDSCPEKSQITNETIDMSEMVDQIVSIQQEIVINEKSIVDKNVSDGIDEIQKKKKKKKKKNKKNTNPKSEELSDKEETKKDDKSKKEIQMSDDILRFLGYAPTPSACPDPTSSSSAPSFISPKDPKLDDKMKMRSKYGNGKNLVAIGPQKVRDPLWLKGFQSPSDGERRHTTPEHNNTIGVSHSSPFSFSFGF